MAEVLDTPGQVWVTNSAGGTSEWPPLVFESKVTDPPRDRYWEKVVFRHFVITCPDGPDLPEACSIRIEYGDRILVAPDVRKVWVGVDEDGLVIEPYPEWRTFEGTVQLEWMDEPFEGSHIVVGMRPPCEPKCEHRYTPLEEWGDNQKLVCDLCAGDFDGADETSYTRGYWAGLQAGLETTDKP